jgi:hypothetical protein
VVAVATATTGTPFSPTAWPSFVGRLSPALGLPFTVLKPRVNWSGCARGLDLTRETFG